jgi:hypothetical protein
MPQNGQRYPQGSPGRFELWILMGRILANQLLKEDRHAAARGMSI